LSVMRKASCVARVMGEQNLAPPTLDSYDPPMKEVAH
jgi:hypothetical protein